MTEDMIQDMRKDTILMTVQRSSGFISTTLRSLLLLLMMMVGVGEMWGQAGIWYIANSSSGNAPATEYTYDANSPENNYYLVPAADPQLTNKRDAYYSGDNYATAGDPARPFITTYKTGMDNNSIWFIESSGDGYYFIIHAATGKYLIYEPPHSGATNRKSMHLQTVDNSTYSPSTNNNFKFKFETSGSGYRYTIRPYSVTSGNRFFNVANRNFNRYYGSTAPSNNYDHEGLVGLYSSGHVWVLKDASNAAFVKPVISDVDVSTSTFTISFPTVSITYPYTTSLTEDIKALGITSIIYTTNDDEPTVGGATTKTYSSAVWLGESCTVKARGVYGNGSMTPVVSKSFENIPAVCALPTFTYNHTDKTVTITSLGPTDATFYYTLNGDNPTATVSETNFQYADTPIAIPDNCNVVKAIAVKDGYANSIVSSISRVETPTFGSNAQGITISSATEDASIFYTTDGSDPTTDSTPYVGAINLPSGTTIKAIAVKDGYIHSSIVSFTSLLPTEIRYDAANNKVVITNATDGATIYYTTGTTESDTPDPNGSEKIEYIDGNSGFELEDNVNFIKAIAVKGSDMSPEAQLAIVIHASTAGADRPYLIQSVECTDFYMIPGDNNSLNTSSLGRASMEWCFYHAGKSAGNADGGVAYDYYYIKNKNTNQYVYFEYANNKATVRMDPVNTFNSANATGKNNYKYRLTYLNDANNPGYYIHPYTSGTAANGLTKISGNNTADAVNLADATIAANSFGRWNFVPPTSYNVTLPFKAWGEGGEYKYYKIKKENTNTDATNYLIPRTETVSYAIASTASNVSGPANSILWYFDKDVEASSASAPWVSYYYIVNAGTGEYLYFNGDATKSANNNAFIGKEELDESKKDRYLFAFAKTITANKYYILPKVLQNLVKDKYSLVFWDGYGALTSAADRAADGGKWYLAEADVTDLCPPRVKLDADGNVTISSRTRGATIKYKVGSETDFNNNAIPQMTDGSQVVITTQTTLEGVETTCPVTVVYKPTVELKANQTFVYNGQTHAPELNSVMIGTEDITNYCEVSSDDINAGDATAVVTQKENNPFYSDPYYVIYGTAPFTIEKSPLTIYADSKMIEYGDAIPELSFSTYGLATIDEVHVNLGCNATISSEIGNYPITFSNLDNKTVKYEIKRNNDDASPNYKDITLVPSSLIITGKSLGDGTQMAEGITAELTTDGEGITITAGTSTVLNENDYGIDKTTEGLYDDIIWKISGEGHYTGSAQLARVKSNFSEKDNEWRAGYVASHDWAIPEGSNIKAWIAIDVNHVLNVLRVKEVNYLPAGVPAILTATADKSGGVLTSPKPDDIADLTVAQKNGNLFEVVEDANGLNVTTDDTYKYVFHKGELVLAFRGTTLPKGTIYVDSHKNGSPVTAGAPLRIEKVDDLTGIIEINEDKNIRPMDDKWYSLDGRKLSGKPVQKGLYINKGRKIVVK